MLWQQMPRACVAQTLTAPDREENVRTLFHRPFAQRRNNRPLRQFHRCGKKPPVRASPYGPVTSQVTNQKLGFLHYKCGYGVRPPPEACHPLKASTLCLVLNPINHCERLNAGCWLLNMRSHRSCNSGFFFYLGPVQNITWPSAPWCLYAIWFSCYKPGDMVMRKYLRYHDAGACSSTSLFGLAKYVVRSFRVCRRL
jgi:hypothetical protein